MKILAPTVALVLTLTYYVLSHTLASSIHCKARPHGRALPELRV